MKPVAPENNKKHSKPEIKRAHVYRRGGQKGIMTNDKERRFKTFLEIHNGSSQSKKGQRRTILSGEKETEWKKREAENNLTSGETRD